MVINALTDGSNHIPYRESKLTRILQESLGGNSKTCLIITCSPSAFNEAETLSTLRFGKRSKKIKNKPIVNKEVSVQELQLEIRKLEEELKSYRLREKENFNFNTNNSVFQQKYEQDSPVDGKDFKIENLQINIEQTNKYVKHGKSESLNLQLNNGNIFSKTLRLSKFQF